MKSMGEFTSFQKLLPKALKKYKMDREARASLVCNKFRELATALIGEESKVEIYPKFFKGGSLYISVPSSAWAQKVIFERHHLISKINEEIGEDFVHELRTVVESIE